MMNTRRLVLKGLVAAGFVAGAAVTSAVENSHSFFVCGWASGGPAIYNEQFEKTWSLASEDELSDGWLLPDGGVVFSYSRRAKTSGEDAAGVIRLDENKEKLWEYAAPAGHDVHSCQPLPHGGFLLSLASKKGLWMLELDQSGQEFKRVQVANKVKDIHHACRAVRKTPQGTYLGTVLRDVTANGKVLKGGRAYEWDAAGEVLRTFPSGFFHAIRLPNGHTLVSEGSGHNGALVNEYDPDNKLVWSLTSADLKNLGIKLSMACGLQYLPNGNVVVATAKHGKHFSGDEQGTMYKTFEVTRDKKLVWAVPPEVSGKNMGSVQILNVPGDPYKMEVFR